MTSQGVKPGNSRCALRLGLSARLHVPRPNAILERRMRSDRPKSFHARTVELPSATFPAIYAGWCNNWRHMLTPRHQGSCGSKSHAYSPS